MRLHFNIYYLISYCITLTNVHHVLYLTNLKKINGKITSCWVWAYLMKVITERCRVHSIRYLRFYDIGLILTNEYKLSW